MPLAIELAAARVRALSLAEILASLHDRFRLLTGGARTAVRRQQTLRASVDWSHALLTEPERILFRRLAVFLGGFDLDAARAVAGSSEVERYQVLDQLTLLVDKSLVVASDSEASEDRTRYRLLETVRQYALEKLGDSGEADEVRARHRDHYTAMAAVLDAPAGTDYEQHLEQANLEIDNLRAAFGWSRENSDGELALALASSLQPLWVTRGRLREGLAWFDATLADLDAHHTPVTAAVRARALADKAVLDNYLGATNSLDQAEQAVAIARDVHNPALLARTLTSYGFIASLVYQTEVARECFAEAIGLARTVDDQWRLSQILTEQARCAHIAGDPLGICAVAEEGRDLADAIGDRSHSRACRFYLAIVQQFGGDLAGSAAQLGEVAAEAEAAHDEIWRVTSLGGRSIALGRQGEATAARAAAEAILEGGAGLGGRWASFGHVVCGFAALAAGDFAAVHEAREAACSTRFSWAAARRDCGASGMPRPRWQTEISLLRAAGPTRPSSTTTGWWLMSALTARARVAIAQGEPDQAERDAHDALGMRRRLGAHLGVPDMLECLAVLAGDGASHREATRLLGAAHAIRQRMGAVRFKVYDADYEASVAVLRDALGDKDFDAAWAEGAALSTEEAIAYAQRGRGERKRPTSGWASLTPTERDVVRLVSEGLANKDIATRLFVSPRTVQTHLTHVYTKLGLTSRVQLVQEAARHT